MAKIIADDFLNDLKIPASVRAEALKKAKEGYVMALVEAGEISSGRAGKILGVSRLEFLEMMGILLLGKYQGYLENVKDVLDRIATGDENQRSPLSASFNLSAGEKLTK